MFWLVSVHCTRMASVLLPLEVLSCIYTVQYTLLTNKNVPVQWKERGNFRGQHSVVRIAIRYGLSGPGIEPRLRRYLQYPYIPAPRPTQPLAILYQVSLQGIKRPGRGVGHPIYTSAEVKEVVEYSTTVSRPVCVPFGTGIIFLILAHPVYKM